jgi:hypothetical protein
MRNVKKYKVIDECETDYCVEEQFPFCENGKIVMKTLKLWWDKKLCNEI